MLLSGPERLNWWTMSSVVPPNSERDLDETPGDEMSTKEATSRLIRSLLALPELPMRVAWLNDRLPAPALGSWVKRLDRLCELAQSTSKDAREALLPFAVLVSSKYESSWVWALRLEAKGQSLLSLERLLREGPRGEEESAPDSGATEKRVPDYGTGRELTVGERRTLARRPTRPQVERLLLDPHPLVIEQLIGSPTVTEADIITIATRRPASLDAMNLLVNSGRWIARRRIRMSLILNPGTPLGLALPFVSTCPREDLQLIATTTTIHLTLRTVARELYTRLPPVSEATTHRFHQ